MSIRLFLLALLAVLVTTQLVVAEEAPATAEVVASEGEAAQVLSDTFTRAMKGFSEKAKANAAKRAEARAAYFAQQQQAQQAQAAQADEAAAAAATATAETATEPAVVQEAPSSTSAAEAQVTQQPSSSEPSEPQSVQPPSAAQHKLTAVDYQRIMDELFDYDAIVRDMKTMGRELDPDQARHLHDALKHAHATIPGRNQAIHEAESAALSAASQQAVAEAAAAREGAQPQGVVGSVGSVGLAPSTSTPGLKTEL